MRPHSVRKGSRWRGSHLRGFSEQLQSATLPTLLSGGPTLADSILREPRVGRPTVAAAFAVEVG